MWTFRYYSPGRGGGFRGWFDSQLIDAQEQITETLEILAAQDSWAHSLYHEPLRGALDGLEELKVDFLRNGTQVCLRILGFTRPGLREFVMLLGFEKTTGAEYATEGPKAFNRKKGVLKDANRAPVWPIP